ncbi:MAG: hypothetical protein EXS44_02955 [Candidatus Levybacteria bacterium]|nr:hypothetical protein [Candidatus Levybacteria bacterium]
MLKLLLVIFFFILTPIFLISSSIILLSINQQQEEYIISLSLFQKQKNVSYAALPDPLSIMKLSIIQKDIRVEALETFFKNYGSQLTPFAQNIISMADKYNIDSRLIPAIAMQESNLCKKIIKDSYNCWGFGIYGKNVKKFKGFAQAIEAISKTLAEEYRDKRGLISPEQIATRYTSPASKEAWTNNVVHFMAKISTQ